MDESTAQGQKWTDAWMTYEEAIAQPWNDFVSRAEQLSVEDAELDMQTDEEIIRFISDNTYVDGASLTDTYPEINEWIADMKNSTDWEAIMNYDAIRAPMNTTQPIMLQSNYEDPYYYDDEYVEEPTKFESAMNEAMDKIQDKAVEYGFDPTVAKQWLMD